MVNKAQCITSMHFALPLNSATMLRRYKRFLADVRLPNDARMTLHCANTGAMLGCVFPQFPVFYSLSDNPQRKLRGTLELVQTPDDHLVCVNTNQANRLVKQALANRAIVGLSGESFRSEVKIPDESGRFDFGNENVYVEVKSVTYLRDGVGVFPDAKSVRATKHVNALRRCVERGKRGVLVFCVLHTGIEQVAVAADIDPIYAVAVSKAIDAGVEVLAFRCNVSREKLELERPIEFLHPSNRIA